MEKSIQKIGDAHSSTKQILFMRGIYVKRLLGPTLGVNEVLVEWITPGNLYFNLKICCDCYLQQVLTRFLISKLLQVCTFEINRLVNGLSHKGLNPMHPFKGSGKCFAFCQVKIKVRVQTSERWVFCLQETVPWFCVFLRCRAKRKQGQCRRSCKEK